MFSPTHPQVEVFSGIHRTLMLTVTHQPLANEVSNMAASIGARYNENFIVD